MQQLEVFEAFREERHRHWYECGFNPDGSTRDGDSPLPEETRLEFLERLQQSDNEAFEAFQMKITCAVEIIQQAWRKYQNARTPNVFLIM